MKNASRKWLVTLMVIAFTAYFQDSNAQTATKRYPDGSVVYSDGTVKLPNGQVRYPNTTNGNTYPTSYPDYGSGRYPRTSTRNNDGSVIYPDGRIVYPDGTVRYPDGQVYSRNRNSRWIPPGQAKKMYGSKSARDYAPGHNKGYNKHDKNKHDNKHDKNKSRSKGKHK